MMAFKDRAGQIIKLLPARLTVVALPVSLMGMKAAFAHLLGIAMRTVDAVRPADFAHFFVAFLLVNQVVDLEKHPPILSGCFSYDHLLETV